MATPVLHPELAAVVREVLARAAQPLNMAKIRSSLSAPYKVAPKLKDAFTGLLDAEAAAGRLYIWPPATAKGGLRYWTLDARAWALQTLLKTAAVPVSQAALIKAVSTQYGKGNAEALVGELCESGELVRIPLFGGTPAKTQLCSVIPDPAAFRAELEAARRIIEAGYRKLESAPPPSLLTAERVLALLEELEPQKGLLVTASRLRRALGPEVSKHDLDALLVRLQEDRRVILHRHSNPHSLAEGDRETLIRDADGNYYVGACWRVENS